MTRNDHFTPPPVFVVGPPRCGTTLVASILGRHSDVFSPAPGETNYFNHFDISQECIVPTAAEQLLDISANRSNRDNIEFTRLVEKTVDLETLIDRSRDFGAGHRGLYYAFTSILAENAGKKCFCDDTPRHVFDLHGVLETFPEAKIIGCIRDPRDFLASYRNFWKTGVDPERIRRLYHPVLTALLWRASANILMSYARNPLYRSNFVLVKYESLVERPARETRRVCEILGLQYSDQLIDIRSHNSSFESKPSGIFNESVGQWNAHLSQEEIYFVQTLTAAQMAYFRYRTEPSDPSSLALFRIVASTPLAVINALQANSGKIGSVRKYLNNRFRPL